MLASIESTTKARSRRRTTWEVYLIKSSAARLRPAVGLRHDVAKLSVSRYLPWMPGMFLPVSTQACYRCAGDGVRSSADNVPSCGFKR